MMNLNILNIIWNMTGFRFSQSKKTYKEIYSSKEGKLSITLSFLITFYILELVIDFPKLNITYKLTNILGIILGGGFGLLGFLVGGMAIIVGSIDQSTITIIDKDGKYENLLSIIFRFYYDGVIIGLLIIISIINYFLLMLPLKFNLLLLFLLTFLNSDLFFYSLLLSVMLLGTAIRLMNLNHKFYEEEINSQNRKNKKDDTLS
ncbi:hypothetical protein SDC49_26025 [Lactobacillus sp. R2/2]|nr:hypothetical protein [Lactobacillus sp. R2/2]MEB3365707.1 hypothetical protein [Lactobacillus sp. R2/2]